MADRMRFIISHGGTFLNIEDNWKWLGNRTTSIVVRSDVTFEELLNLLSEKLSIDRVKFQIQLKFTVPNMNIPPADVLDDEDLQWYISVHTQAVLCVIVDELDPNRFNANVANELSPAVEGAVSTHEEMVVCELQESGRIPGTELSHDEEYDQVEDNHDDEQTQPLLENTITLDSQGVIAENQIYFSKKQLHTRLALKALTEKFHFKVKKSNPRNLTVCCIDSTCRWFVRASKIKSSDIFMIRRYIPDHTCSLDVRRNANKHATSTLIGQHIMRRLDDANQPYVPVGIIGDMEREYGVHISYNKAWRGKEKGLNHLRGSPEESFFNLASYCHVLTAKNPGTITHIELDRSNRFLYLFVAFGPSIRGFREYLRPVICVDCSHLKGKYKGILLVAAGQNANMQVYPVAWGIVDAETNASWEWFFSKLKGVVDDSERLVFISDRKNSIKRAITMLYPQSHHGACIWHIEKNLISRYSNSNAIILFKRAALAYRVSEFEQVMDQIKIIRPAMAGYLTRAGISSWSRANFGGNRYNIMTNNIAESLNSVLRRERSYPITALVECIRAMTQKWFFERRNASSMCTSNLTPKLEVELRKSFDAGTTMQVHNLDEMVMEVGVGSDLATVDLTGNTCSCREFQLREMPCAHACRAACSKQISLYALCSPYYTASHWRASYSEVINPLGNKCHWIVPHDIRSIVISPPNIRRPPGRPPTQRRRSRMESSTTSRKCGRCGNSGHNRLTCRHPTPSSSRRRQ